MTPVYVGFPFKQVETKIGPFVLGVEKMAAVAAEIKPLHVVHWDEVESSHSPLTFDVDYERYEKFEQQGSFALFTVRERIAQNQLVGYFMCYLQRANHAKADFVAREDALFLDPLVRGAKLSNHLLDYVEDVLKQLGVKVLILSSRHHTGGTNLGPWLVGRKFIPTAVVYTKEL